MNLKCTHKFLVNKFENLEMSFRWQIKICQYDFNHYSKLVRSVTEPVDLSLEGGEFSFLDMRWRYSVQKNEIPGQPSGMDVRFNVELIRGEARECNVLVELVFGQWCSENYVSIPAAAYNGNRFESRRVFYSPKLLETKDIGPDKPPVISDVPRLNIHDGPSCIDDRSGSISTPSMGFFSPASKHGVWMLFSQSCVKGDFGCRVTENRDKDQAIFSVSAPVVRERYKYRITDNQFPSDDRAPDWEAGDNVSIPLHLYSFECRQLQILFDTWNTIRYNLIPRPAPLRSLAFSSTFKIQEQKFNSQNWVEKHGYYSVGMREIFLQDWQIGWTGGMISTYPLLFGGGELARERVLRNFDFVFPNGISPSGFFYDSGEAKSDGFHWYGGDIRRPHTANWHLVRKSGDGLYYVVKQFMLMGKAGIPIKPAWNQGAETVAEAFVRLWERYHQTGNYVNSISGDLVVGGSTSGGIVPAALTYAYLWFKDSRYLKVAEAIADYLFSSYVKEGLSTGGVGDAMQNPDSESAYGMLESFAVLYEQTGEQKWLDRAENMANQFFTWITGYNYEFPPDSTLGKLGVKTLGSVFANTQNKHAAPGICTYSGVALLRLYRATGEMQYLEMLRDIVRFVPQMLSHPKREIPGMQPGWMTERVSMTDWFEGIGELMTGSTWAETSLMLIGVEIPGIYVVPSRELVFPFDSVDVDILNMSEDLLEIMVKNPGEESCTIRIFVDNPQREKLPLGENYLWDAKEINVGPREEKQITLIFKK